MCIYPLIFIVSASAQPNGCCCVGQWFATTYGYLTSSHHSNLSQTP